MADLGHLGLTLSEQASSSSSYTACGSVLGRQQAGSKILAAKCWGF